MAHWWDGIAEGIRTSVSYEWWQKTRSIRVHLTQSQFSSNTASKTKALSFRSKRGTSHRKLLLPALWKGHKNALKLCALLRRRKRELALPLSSASLNAKVAQLGCIRYCVAFFLWLHSLTQHGFTENSYNITHMEYEIGSKILLLMTWWQLMAEFPKS